MDRDPKKIDQEKSEKWKEVLPAGEALGRQIYKILDQQKARWGTLTITVEDRNYILEEQDAGEGNSYRHLIVKKGNDTMRISFEGNWFRIVMNDEPQIVLNDKSDPALMDAMLTKMNEFAGDLDKAHPVASGSAQTAQKVANILKM